jgi:two-component system, chemotaxis family, sensor histidine kinase and response regulator WspE
MSVSSLPPPDDLSMLELFLADAAANGAVLVQGLHRLSSGSADRALLLPELAIAAQSIKGAASIVHFDPGRIIADELQSSLRRLEEGQVTLTPQLTAALLGAAEALCAMAATPAGELFRGAAAGNDDNVRIVLDALRAPPRGAAAEDGTAPQNGPIEAHGSPEPPVRRSTQPPRESSPPAVDPAILELFYTETESCAATLSRGLAQLEPGDSAGLEDLMRAAHSLKGAARIVDIGVATRLAHAMEECFVAAQSQSLVLGSRHVDLLLEAVDVLADIARHPAGGLARWQAEKGPLANQLMERLQRAAAGEPIPDATPVDVNVTTASASVVAPEALADRRSSAEQGALVKSSSSALRAAANPQDRVVRVAAQSINRLMGLAGESLVESRRVQTLGSSMQRLKRKQSDLADVLEALTRQAEASLDPETAALVADAKFRALDCRTLLVEQITGLESYARRVDDLSDRLYREALKSRMRPFGDCAHGLPRMVRDLGRQLGKQVRLLVSGEKTDVDRDVLESLEAPLSHLLRNALDHGIEPAEERLLKGKPAVGTVRVEARHHAGVLAITVSDDGGGIDPEKIRTKIVERALLNPKVAAELGRAELLEFIFLPGFSTASGVTEISGRGVGLDAVRTAVEAASGVVKVTSDSARGTSFHLQLPVTRSVMRAVVAEVAGEAYAFPLLRIERILRLPASEVRTLSNAQYFVLAEANISLVCAQQILGLGLPPAMEGELSVVVVSDRIHRYGVTVDKFLGEHDLVVRPLDARLGKVQDIAAAAILMNGLPALIFDVDDVVRSIEKLAHAGRVDKLSARSLVANDRPQKRILVVDDSITVREAERQLLANHGYSVDVAVDGMDGWNSMINAHYDLVISDIDMPRMNGLELVRTIKQDPKLSSTPIVIVSYKDREEDRMRGLDAGANYYLTKSSFHDESLVQAVEELIGAANS